MRLLIAVLCVLGAAAGIWLLGHVGFRLGFAPTVGVPTLLAAPQDGLIGGLHTLLNVPFVIIAAGLVQPLWLMLAIVLIGLPAASLGAARPGSPGGPRPTPFAVTMSNIGATVGMVTAAALLAWTVSPLRAALFREFPADVTLAAQWYEHVTLAAGMDVLAWMCAVLWVVLLTRLRMALWLKSLSLVICAVALAGTTCAMALTGGTVTQVQLPRMMIYDAGRPHLVLGSTREHMAILRDDGHDRVSVQLIAPPSRLDVQMQRSILEFTVEAKAGGR